MHVQDITLVGWAHAVASLFAVAAGAWNLVATKGTAVHRTAGRIYFWAMIVLNLTAFAIYRFDIVRFVPFHAGPGTFGFFHWLAVIALALVLLGRFAAAHQARAPWAYAHPACMVLSYYLLVGGGINEAFARIDALHALALKSFGRTVAHPVNAPVIAMTHTAAMAAALVLLIYFIAKVALYRSRSRAAA